MQAGRATHCDTISHSMPQIISLNYLIILRYIIDNKQELPGPISKTIAVNGIITQTPMTKRHPRRRRGDAVSPILPVGVDNFKILQKERKHI